MSSGSALVKDLHYAGTAIWQVLLVSIVLGAGLPMVFALGVRSLAWGSAAQSGEGPDGEGQGIAGAARTGNPAGKVIAALLFAVVLYILAIGIYFIIAGGHGKELAFHGIWPEQVAKK